MRIRTANILMLILVLLFTNRILLANNEIDSLEKNYNKFNNKEKVNAFQKLSEYYQPININKSYNYLRYAYYHSKLIDDHDGQIQACLFYTKLNYMFSKNAEGDIWAQKVIDLSNKYSIKKYLPRYYYILGTHYAALSDYSKAIVTYNTGLKYAQYLNDWDIEGTIYIEIGKLYFKWGNLNDALKNYMKAEEIFINNNCPIQYSYVKGYIGYSYTLLGQEKKAFEYFNQAIEINKKYGFKKNLASVYEYLGDYYIDKKDKTNALIYYLKSKDLNVLKQENQHIGNIYTKIAYCYYIIGDYKNSLNNNFKALLARQEYGVKEYTCSSYNNIGMDFLKLNQLDSAEKYFKYGLALSIETNSHDYEIRAYKRLSEVYEKEGKYKASLDCYKKYNYLSDSNYSIAKYNKIIEYQNKLDKERKEMEKSKNELERQQSILLFILLISIVFVVFVIIITFLYYSKRRDNNRLATKTKELNLAIEELNLNKEELSTLNFELEERVSERTKELYYESEQRKLIEENYILFNEELEKAYEKSEIAFKKEKELSVHKSNFIQMISHEFRTPLTVINSSSELINTYIKFGKMEKINKMINNIIDSVNEISNFIEDVFIFNRLEEHTVRPIIYKINPSVICLKIIDDFYKSGLNNKNISFINNNSDIYIKSDISILQQILNRLIKNAIKYSPDNTNIILEIVKDTDNIKLIISDNGWGINPNEQEYIFNAFHREGKYIGIIPGLGLGLAIVKKFVEIMNWKIEFESELNKGTSFSITIPIDYEN